MRYLIEEVVLIDIMKNAFVLLTNRQLTLPEFSVTSNLPSQMNGGKDFCEWSRRDRELAKTIGKPVAVVLGKYGKGFVDIALAESFYEKGGDNYEILSLVSRGRMQAEAGGKLEQCFVAAAIQARVHVINGQIEEAVEILKHFRNVAVKEHGDKLLPNIDTFCFVWRCIRGKKHRLRNGWRKLQKRMRNSVLLTVIIIWQRSEDTFYMGGMSGHRVCWSGFCITQRSWTVRISAWSQRYF